MLRFYGQINAIVMASGSGSTFQAIIESCKRVKVEYLFCNNPDAYALQRAVDRKIPVLLAHPDEMLHHINKRQPNLIILAGYMKILPDDFVDEWYGRIINIHPSLLPKYEGLNTYQRVLEAGDEWHGSTIHVVNKELDRGPIIAQRKIKTRTGVDDAMIDLECRTHEMEHRFYPEILDEIADGAIQLPDTEGEPVLRIGPGGKWREPEYS